MYSWACINFLSDTQSVFFGVQKRGNGRGRDFLSRRGRGAPEILALEILTLLCS